MNQGSPHIYGPGLTTHMYGPGLTSHMYGPGLTTHMYGPGLTTHMYGQHAHSRTAVRVSRRIKIMHV